MYLSAQTFTEPEFSLATAYPSCSHLQQVRRFSRRQLIPAGTCNLQASKPRGAAGCPVLPVQRLQTPLPVTGSQVLHGSWGTAPQCTVAHGGHSIPGAAAVEGSSQCGLEG